MPDTPATDRPTLPTRLAWRLEYAGLRSLDGLFRLLPLEAASRLSGRLWRAVAPRLGRHRRADRHLAAMMPDLPPAERQRILRAMWGNLGETFLEGLQIDRLAAEPGRIVMDDAGFAAMRRSVAEGGIVAVPHLGNWEALVLVLAAQPGANLAGVYRQATNPLVDAHILRARRPFYPGGLSAKGQAAARTLIRQAKSGCSVGLLSDLRDGNGVLVPFFGRPAPSTPVPAMLARQFGRPLFAACLVRTATSRYRLEVAEVTVPHTADRAADIHAATAGIHQVFEGWIRHWPEQWMWAHRRYAG